VILRTRKQSQSIHKGKHPASYNFAVVKSQFLTDLINSPKKQFFCKFMQHRQSNISVMAETINDELLVEQFSQSNESAFESIIRLYSADVAALANRLLGWPGEVEDITQDIFLAAFLGLKKFRRDCSLKTWLFTITINKCRSFRYKRKLRKLRTIPIPTNDIGMRLPPAGAYRELMEAETFERVRNAIAALPAKYREAVVLRYLQELPTEEISRILGISKNTLQVRLNRARERLKLDLAEFMEK
jgi:RNA polymerase sigma factor (sigma-70 family)